MQNNGPIEHLTLTKYRTYGGRTAAQKISPYQTV
jgi:hypothetical protein